MKKLMVVGLGGAGTAEVVRFPDTSEITLTRVVVDWPDALQRIGEDIGEIRRLALGATHGRKKTPRKTADSTRRAFAVVLEGLESDMAAADGLVLCAGLGGITGSIGSMELARFAKTRKLFVAAKLFWPMDEANTQSMERTKTALSRLSADCQMVTVVNSLLVGRSISDGVYLDHLLDAMLALHVCHAMDLFRTLEVLQNRPAKLPA